MRKNFNAFITTFMLGISLVSLSCKKYLDVKQSKGQIQVNSLNDIQLLLDDVASLNNGNPGLLEIGTDNYEIDYSDFVNLDAFDQQLYTWEPEIVYEITNMYSQWRSPYQTIFVANVALDQMEWAVDRHKPEADEIKGAAFFWRSFMLFQAAQVYCMPFDKDGNNDGLGMPIRLSSDFNMPKSRSTIQQTYDHILEDMNVALSLLPEHSIYVSRPSKTAAHAALARIYLAMEDYEKAFTHADEALKRYDTLIDFNAVDLTSDFPFEFDNVQVILYSLSSGVSGLTHPTRASDTPKELLDQYADGDLRKVGYFIDKGNGRFGFKARYTPYLAGSYFVGFATDELFLIRAECLARNGKTTEALNDLNHLLKHRWDPEKFMPIATANNEEALRIILQERRKELPMRGVRWSDLRRLNKDSRFEKTLTRTLKHDGREETYTLPPNDLRYAFPIPQMEIDMLGIPQNPR